MADRVAEAVNVAVGDKDGVRELVGVSVPVHTGDIVGVALGRNVRVTLGEDVVVGVNVG